MNAPRKTSYTFVLTPPEQQRLLTLLRQGNYRPVAAPHTQAAVETTDCRVNLYTSGKCLVQGQGAEDWVLFHLEPEVLQRAATGYESALNPDRVQPHAGVDESGKGDFFGPLVIAAVYCDAALAAAFDKLGVRDSKSIGSDRKILALAAEIRGLVGRRMAEIKIGPRKYNELYAKMGNVNRMLAWGHARAIESVLEAAPDCPRAVADQFGPKQQIERALFQRGRKIILEQRPRAESDPAVAAASIMARAGFVQALAQFEARYQVPFPKGASAQVRAAAVALVRQHGPAVLLEVAKCHFRTTDEVLAGAGATRAELGPLGAARSQAQRPDFKRKQEDNR
ncbi:MAG: ribonuclease HIII [Candidatus Marinimicrobia bacterium]|nr:ribonuclease HIII [Candidatus Neomarinimicrobiota bacterium]